jgi:hypothetical protein
MPTYLVTGCQVGLDACAFCFRCGFFEMSTVLYHSEIGIAHPSAISFIGLCHECNPKTMDYAIQVRLALLCDCRRERSAPTSWRSVVRPESNVSASICRVEYMTLLSRVNGSLLCTSRRIYRMQGLCSRQSRALSQMWSSTLLPFRIQPTTLPMLFFKLT